MSAIKTIEDRYKKKAVVAVRSGDTIKVHQKIREGGKERIQIFEGLVIKTGRRDSLTSTFTVRRVASGVGVEKTYLIHSPNILKIEIVKRSKVRRNYLSYMRELTGKSARMAGVDFDKEAVNAIADEEAEEQEAKIHEEALAKHDEQAAKEAEEEAKAEAKAAEALAKHAAKSEAEKIEEQPKA
jgi:large subunit ribosomal protein L19